MMKYLRLSFGLILFFVECAAIAQRASNWRAFRVADGLPESACMSVTISSPGRVVVRHLDKAFVSQLDGYTITTEPAPPLGMSRVYASPGGQLWSLSPTGLQELREGEWLTHPVKEIAAVSAGKTIDPVSLCAIKQGVVLMLLPEALIEFNAENPALAKTIVIRTVERTRLGAFTGMGLAKDGGLWVAGSRGLAKLPGPLRALKPGSDWVEWLMPASFNMESLQDPHEDVDGIITMLGQMGEGSQKIVIIFDGKTWRKRSVGNQRIRRAWRGPDQQTWAATVDGLFQMPDEGPELIENEELSARNYFDVAVEPGGTFWLATSDGLFRYTPLPWRTPRSVQNINSLAHSITSDEQGTLWFIAGGRLHLLNDQRSLEVPLSASSLATLQRVRSLFGAKDGRLIVDTGDSLFELNPTSGDSRKIDYNGGYTRILGRFRNGYVCLSQTNSHESIKGKLLTYDGLTFSEFLDAPADMDLNEETSVVYGTQNGDFWVGNATGTAWWHEGKWRVFPGADKSAPDSVVGFVELADGKIWCGARDQIWEFDNKNWSVVRRGFDRLNSMIRTRDGIIWIASNTGVQRFNQGVWLDNGIEEGLPGTVVRELYEDSRGRLWAGTTHGLSQFHPEADSEPPQTFIRPMTDEQRNVPEGRIVSINFGALDRWKCTPRERLLYSHQLDGQQWSLFQETPGVTFSDISPGKHYFQVKAMDRMGNIDPKQAQVEFAIVLPWFRETRLVLISSAGAMVAVFFAALAFNRHRRLVRSYAEVESKVKERTKELELANRELLHSQKMTALGTLAAGIAHDFNNILSIVKGSAQIIEENLENANKIRTRVDRIKTVVEQGSGIVKAMLGFSRDGGSETVACDVNLVVEDTLRLLGDRFLREVQVSFEPTRELPLVIASRDFIQQILLNFIFNAAESLAEKKEVVVTTSSYKIVPSGPVLLPNPAPAYVTIAVRDYGCGIPLENMSRIFEPFFTTKAFSARRGTGLGLSMVYELAKKIGAGLAVESELEKGSTFILILPVVEEPLAKPQSSVENPNVSNEF